MTRSITVRIAVAVPVLAVPVLAVVALVVVGCAAPPTPESFAAARLASYPTGCMVLRDPVDGAMTRLGAPTTTVRRSPCSTFKIPNALIALDLGVVEDASTVFAWDGTPQPYASWAKDQTLRSAMANSVVWVFQRLARAIGPQRMQAALDRLDYGNRDLSKGIDTFWLHPASLGISPEEQVAFLERLYADALPISPRAMAIVRDMLVWRERDGWVLSGKTGSGRVDGRGLGWYVGHVRRPDGRARVFATVLEGDAETGGMTTRALTVRMLHDLGWWPEAAP